MMKENCFGDGRGSTKSPMSGMRREGSPRGLWYLRGGLRRSNGDAVGCGLRAPAGNPAAGMCGDAGVRAPCRGQIQSWHPGVGWQV